MSLILTSPFELQKYRKQLATEKKSVGFVPTMGALHKGHETLLKQARVENDIVILSIFVNPTQFNNPQDLAKYPKTWDQDLAMAKDNRIDAIFFPEYSSMYPDNYKYKVLENEFSFELCGKDRPGHFDGVLTVVTKLLNLVQADRAYFGEKDYQQLQLIKGMCEAFFIPTTIVPVPTVRELDGLAMSSRNVRLTEEGRILAPQIFKIITSASTSHDASVQLEALGYKVDYVVDKYGRRFVAVKTMGRDGIEVRLIDNVKI